MMSLTCCLAFEMQVGSEFFLEFLCLTMMHSWVVGAEMPFPNSDFVIFIPRFCPVGSWYLAHHLSKNHSPSSVSYPTIWSGLNSGKTKSPWLDTRDWWRSHCISGDILVPVSPNAFRVDVKPEISLTSVPFISLLVGESSDNDWLHFALSLSTYSLFHLSNAGWRPALSITSAMFLLVFAVTAMSPFSRIWIQRALQAAWRPSSSFLAASGQLYKRVCRSVGWLVGRSVVNSFLSL